MVIAWHQCRKLYKGIKQEVPYQQFFFMMTKYYIQYQYSPTVIEQEIATVLKSSYQVSTNICLATAGTEYWVRKDFDLIQMTAFQFLHISRPISKNLAFTFKGLNV